MSRYRKVELKTWTDEKFRRLSPMPPSGQGLWLFLMTGPHTGPIPGLFRAGRAGMAEELDWDIEAFDKAFAEVFDQGMAKADFKARVVWLPNALKHNKPESPNVVRSWRVELDLLPECDLKTEAVAYIRDFLKGFGEAYLLAFDEITGDGRKPSGNASPKPSTKAMPNQEQEQEQELTTDANASVVAGEAGSASSVPKLPDCPQQEILDLFAECLPELPQPVAWGGNRAEHLRARWRWLQGEWRKKSKPTGKAEGLDFFRRMFEHIQKSDFLMGRAGSWQCDLGWIVKAENFAKILQGNYDNGGEK